MTKIVLGKICKIIKGDTPIKKAIEGDYPLVVTGEHRLKHNSYQFDCRAVCIPLVSSTGHGHASINRIHYQEGKFALGSILVAVIPKDEKVIDTRYLYWYLSHFKDSLLVPLMKGGANVSLNLKKLESLEVDVPSFGSQETLILKINKINEIQKNIKNQYKNSELLMKSVLKEAFEV